MPDIAMCFGEGCKKKETCYRFRATPNPYRQSYTKPNPETCDMYWEMEDQRKDEE